MKENEATNVNESTEIVPVITDDSGTLTLFGGSQKATFSSFVPESLDDKKKFFNAINNTDGKLSDLINMEIVIKDVYAEECEYVNEETGELTPGVRIILFTPDGKGYSTSSKGVFNCLSKIFAIFGHPSTWTEPLKARVKQISPAKDRKILLLELV